MKLLKPAWVNHEGHPIFSIDIHPDGSRFATGGQGADCGRVCIWNMSPVINEPEELKENVPKLLCRMDNHLSCVNCVRWSNGGRHLASAGDDKVVMIWQFGGQGGSSFGGVVNAEQWRCAHTLRGHSGDILDLNWSPADQFLATCSVDTTVRIWNAEQFPECLQIISGHSAFVKGVCWDPMNKYLATQSDDKSLRIWRTSDWKEETCITKPFTDCGGTTHVLRLGWCPDGQFLVSAHAMNNLGSTAQIIDRSTWNTEKDFVGHRKAITCVRFSPKMLYKQRQEKKSKFFCMAVGSRDRSLSVWLTNLRRPLVVMHELFNDSVLDVSWTHDGCRFLACSWDGTIAYFEFTREEIGQPLESDDMNAYLHRLYGKNMMINNHKNQNPELDLFVEDVKLLQARKTAQENLKNSLIQNGQTLSNMSKPSNTQDSQSSSRLMKGPTDKQIEMRLSDGRRRITPLYIPPITNGDGMPVPFNSNDQTTFGSSKENTSKIVIEKVDTPTKDFKNSDFSSKVGGGDDQSNVTKEVNNLSTSMTNGTAAVATVHKNSSTNENLNSEQVKKVQKSVPKSVPSTGAFKDKVQVIDKSKIKRKSDVNPPNINSIATPAPPSLPPPKMGRDEPQLAQSSAPANTASSKFNGEKRPERTGRAEGRIILNLFPMRIDKMHTQRIVVTKEKETNSLFETTSFTNPSVVIENDVVSNLNSVKLFDNQDQHWQILLSNRVCGVCNSNQFICVFCEDCTVHVFRLQTGARLICPLIISGMPSRIRCIDHRLLLITTKGQLWMWDLLMQKILLRNVSLNSLYVNSPDTSVDLVRMALSESGLPTLSLSTGRSYVYSSDLETWQLVADSHDPLHHSCELSAPRTGSECSLAQLQRYTKGVQSVFAQNKRLQAEATLSYVDQQLTAARLLRSTDDFRYWINALGQIVIEHGLERRFREICEYLLGPPLRGSTSDWQPIELGLDKRKLLTELLDRSTTNLKLQRVYLEFKEQLEMITLVNGD